MEPNKDNSSSDPQKKLELLLAEIKTKQEDQFDSIDSLDQKTGLLLGFIILFVINLINAKWFQNLQINLSLPILLGFIFQLYLCVLALFACKFQKGPDPVAMTQLFLDETKTYHELLRSLIENFKGTYANNIANNKIEKKKTYLNNAFLALFVTIIFLSYVFIFLK